MRRFRRGPCGAGPAAQGVGVQLKEQPFLGPQPRIAEALPRDPGVLRGAPGLQQGGPLLFLDRLGDRDQQPFAGSEMVDEHPVAGVTLSPEGEGTRIRWTASWDRTLPGRIVHRRLRAIYPDVVGRLIAAAERSALPAEA